MLVVILLVFRTNQCVKRLNPQYVLRLLYPEECPGLTLGDGTDLRKQVHFFGFSSSENSILNLPSRFLLKSITDSLPLCIIFISYDMLNYLVLKGQE